MTLRDILAGILLFSGAVTAPSFAGATVFSVNYTGTVDFTYSYTGAPLPLGIQPGAAVTGNFRFDTAEAQSPTSEIISCSGYCGGDGVIVTFAFPANLYQSVTIAGHTFTTDLGQAWLLDDYTIPGVHFQAVGIDSSLTGAYAEISISHSEDVDQQPLFADVNGLDDINFAAFSSWDGTLFTGPTGFNVSFSAVVPEPGTLALLSLAVSALVLAHARRKRAPLGASSVCRRAV